MCVWMCARLLAQLYDMQREGHLDLEAGPPFWVRVPTCCGGDDIVVGA